MEEYITNLERAYPGYKVRGFNEKIRETEKYRDSAKEWTEKANRATTSYDKDLALTKAEEAMDNYETAKAAIFSGDVFVDQSIQDFEYEPAENEFSLAELTGGRRKISKNRSRIPMDHYTDNNIAQTVEEGEEADVDILTDSITLLVTDSEEAIIFEDIQKTTLSDYDDDRKTMTGAIDSVHSRHMVNAENKKGLEILLGSKSLIEISAENVQEKINANLSGKGKKNAVIITNHSGFAKLDIDINGNALVTKDSASGKMIYKGKYPIEEVPDEILPETGSGSPIVIGDIAHALRFFLIREDSLLNDMIFPANVADRKIRKEIITLTTKSDAAYIVGYLA